ncbi:MAG: Lrp/AsnC family transcriptional regulator [Asgard group archaeon]|nr:Lrp/AsnC family transcriptional regulator [Asgard group archaeon]
MILDEIDRKIVALLIKDARVPAQVIANETDKHLTTITRRQKTLEDEGIIKGYTAVVDYEALGLELTIITELQLSKGKLFETEKEIAKIPSVCGVYDVTGKIDAIVIAKFRNREEVSEFAKKLLAMPYVDRTETHVVLNIIKEDFRLVNII